MPEDILNHIYNFVPNYVKCNLSAKNYEKYNNDHMDYLNENVYGYKLGLNKRFTFDTYVRYLIKNDYYYVFKFVLNKNFKSWKKITKKKRFKNFAYKSKILFYSLYCIENKSCKCLMEIKKIHN